MEDFHIQTDDLRSRRRAGRKNETGSPPPQKTAPSGLSDLPMPLIIGGGIVIALTLIGGMVACVSYLSNASQKKEIARQSEEAEVVATIEMAEKWIAYAPEAEPLPSIRRKLNRIISRPRSGPSHVLATSMLKRIDDEAIWRNEIDRFDQIIENVFAEVKHGNVTVAKNLLQDYLQTPNAVRKTLAQNLLEEVNAAVSRDRALQMLQKLSDAEIISIANNGVESDPIIHQASLLVVWNKTLMRHTGSVLKARREEREATRIAEELRQRREWERRVTEARQQKEREERERKQRELAKKRLAEQLKAEMGEKNKEIMVRVVRQIHSLSSEELRGDCNFGLKVTQHFVRAIREIDSGKRTTESWRKEMDESGFTGRYWRKVETLFKLTSYGSLYVNINDKWITMSDVWNKVIRIKQGLD